MTPKSPFLTRFQWNASLLLIVSLLPLAGSGQQRETREAAQKAMKAFFGPGRQKGNTGVRLLATIQNKHLTELSGLAASTQQRGVLWTHNDSGDAPTLYAINLQGKLLARLQVPKADNEDWEDIALGPGPLGKPAIYIGDIGDNQGARRNTVLYRISEPLVDTRKTGEKGKTAPAESFPFRYPDGSRDAETLLVHPKTGEVVIVTKSANGASGVYTFPLPLQPNQRVTLQKVGNLTFRNELLTGRLGQAEMMTTGGSVSPDGKRLVIRTYLHAYEWMIAPGQSLVAALRGKPRKFTLPLTAQGEAIAYRPDSKALYTTSEGESAPLYEVALP